MKNLIVFAFLAMTTAASVGANPFDAFVGEYKTTSAPQIQFQNSTFCDRFFFSKLTGLKIEANTNGYHQTHIIEFLNPHGEAGQPTMEFSDINEWKTGGSYGKTSGTSTSASNEYGEWDNVRNEKATLSMSIESSGQGYLFSMVEAYFVGASLVSRCSYQVALAKK